MVVSHLSQLSAGFTRLLGNQALHSTVNKSNILSAKLQSPALPQPHAATF